MKVSDLEIGDWVMSTISTDTPVKVYAIGDNFIDLRHEDVRQSGSLVLCDFEPIPLTEEILKANDWVFRPNDGEYCSPIDISYKEPIRLQIGEDGNAFWWIVGTIIITPINYVHQLQHALRLCGLNDLADNFKVEKV